MDHSRIITLEVSQPANAPATILPTNFPIEKGFNYITGICLINLGNHKAFNFSFGDHAGNVKIYPADQSLFAPGVNGSDKFIPVGIPVTSDSMTIYTTVREPLADEIKYQVAITVESR